MNQNNLRRVENGREQLPCMTCGKDLLETEYGIFAFVLEPDHEVTEPLYADAYWACKGRCDLEMQVLLGVEKRPTPWRDIDELTNPLEFERWSRATARLAGDGRMSMSAVAKVEKLKRKLAWVAALEPTVEDMTEYRLLRMLAEL